MEEEAGRTGPAPHRLAERGVKGKAPRSRGGDWGPSAEDGLGLRGPRTILARSELRGLLVDQWREPHRSLFSS